MLITDRRNKTLNNLTIINHEGINVTDSREVAQMIGKRHSDLLESVGVYTKYLTNGKIRPLDFFIENTYQDSKGETRPCYLLTKQGCEMVANKMTGEKGVLFTAEYVQAFNKMEKFTQNNFSINEFKGQLVTLINDSLDDKLSEAKEYYKIKSRSKTDISTYIKKRLGILRADEEYEQVKARVFLLLGISKWEDLDLGSYKTIIPVVDESIRIIKMDRPQQTSIWE